MRHREEWSQGRYRHTAAAVLLSVSLGIALMTSAQIRAQSLAEPWRYQIHGAGCLVTADFDGRPTTTVIFVRQKPRPAPTYLVILNPGRRIVPGGQERLSLDVDGQPLGSFTTVMRMWGKGRGHEIELPDAAWQILARGRVLTLTRAGRVLERLDLANLAELKPRFDHCRPAG